MLIYILKTAQGCRADLRTQEKRRAEFAANVHLTPVVSHSMDAPACTYCSQRFGTWDQLQRHLDSEHPESTGESHSDDEISKGRWVCVNPELIQLLPTMAPL